MANVSPSHGMAVRRMHDVSSTNFMLITKPGPTLQCGCPLSEARAFPNIDAAIEITQEAASDQPRISPQSR